MMGKREKIEKEKRNPMNVKIIHIMFMLLHNKTHQKKISIE